MRAQAISGSQTDERVELENRFFPSFYPKLHKLGFFDFAHELDALVKIDD
jgi:hypothetical protein